MTTLIVAFPKQDETKAVCNMLIRRGYDVAAPCITGAQVINLADTLSSGIIICGYKLADNMLYSELNECKPKSFELLLVTSKQRWEECRDNDIVCESMPIKADALVSTIEMMLATQYRRRRARKEAPKARSREELKIIDDAKHLIMEKNNMSEPEAFRYIQKCSMDSGNTMVESSRMVISIYGAC